MEYVRIVMEKLTSNQMYKVNEQANQNGMNVNRERAKSFYKLYDFSLIILNINRNLKLSGDACEEKHH